MKTYKVLETHIGDDAQNPYVPGDPKVGTRTMPAGEAKALVDLGLLEELPDHEPGPAPEPAAAPADTIEPVDADLAPPSKPAAKRRG